MKSAEEIAAALRPEIEESVKRIAEELIDAKLTPLKEEVNSLRRKVEELENELSRSGGPLDKRSTYGP